MLFYDNARGSRWARVLYNITKGSRWTRNSDSEQSHGPRLSCTAATCQWHLGGEPGRGPPYGGPPEAVQARPRTPSQAGPARGLSAARRLPAEPERDGCVGPRSGPSCTGPLGWSRPGPKAVTVGSSCVEPAAAGTCRLVDTTAEIPNPSTSVNRPLIIPN